MIDVDYFAMENIYEANYAPQPGSGMVGLIYMEARYTSVTLLENGYSMFTGDPTIGGERVHRDSE